MSRSESKPCASCGRRFEWRKAWAERWEHVRYCSAGCRKRRVNALDRRLEAAIVDRLASRRPGATICPSEVAREQCGDTWRQEMETVRRAARRLVHAGVLEIVQKGRAVDPTDFRGPIRLKLRAIRPGDGPE